MKIIDYIEVVNLGLSSFFKRDKKEEEVIDSHIDINPNECDGCKKCIIACPNNVFELIDNKISVYNHQICKSCRVCMAICPNKCITVN